MTGDGRRIRVLLVDDEELVRFGLRQYLQSRLYHAERLSETVGARPLS